MLIQIRAEGGVSEINASAYSATAKAFLADNADLISSSTKKINEVVSNNAEVQAIEESVRGFAESSKVLINALDEVSKLHPFIAGDF